MVKKDGKMIEYYSNGRIQFEGEHKKGKKWNGIGYNIVGDKVYEIKEGKGHVKECDFYCGELLFEGEYLNGERHGKGKDYDKDGKLLFEGEYLNGNKWNGKGYDQNGNIIYELKNGKGTIKEYNLKVNI